MNLLLSPYKIAQVELKNRVVMPPMCMYKADENGMVNDFHLTHYGARAIGGVGLIITEASAVEPRGRISDNDLGLWDDEHIKGHQKLTHLCHGFGTKMAIQLAHAGRKSLCVNSTPIAPSPPIFCENGGYKIPKELSLEEIEDTKRAFVKAAKRAKESGYDILEIHAAHGYLLCEFLSPITNKRSDRYGGSLENRCSLVVEICDMIKEAVDLPLMVRVSADEWVESGWNVNDTIVLSQKLKSIGVEVIHVSAGGNNAIQPQMPELKPLYQTPNAQKIKKEVNIPTIAVGLITTATQGEELLQNGTCDLVAYGRELLRNPNFVFFAAKEMEKKECIETAYARAF
ncbi:MAG: NADH:flavin oxidoreductase/NADH oxidase [Campylobacteraceae bacterium]|nr:NADH:flavin oxidoreductase/NADH oxidase [Campylobacteraceae bacterium]